MRISTRHLDCNNTNIWLFPGFGTDIAVYNYRNPDFSSFASLDLRCLVGVANGLSVLCDVIIAVALSYYLHSKRTGFKRTDSIINRLIIYAVNRGALTAICQASSAISLVAFPGHLFHFPFDLLSGKLYCNTLLATLNAQRAMRGDGHNVVEVDTLVLNRMNTSTTENANRRRVSLSESAARSTPTFVIECANKTVDSAHTRDV